jgi:hypothetical protein
LTNEFVGDIVEASLKIEHRKRVGQGARGRIYNARRNKQAELYLFSIPNLDRLLWGDYKGIITGYGFENENLILVVATLFSRTPADSNSVIAVQIIDAKAVTGCRGFELDRDRESKPISQYG